MYRTRSWWKSFSCVVALLVVSSCTQDDAKDTSADTESDSVPIAANSSTDTGDQTTADSAGDQTVVHFDVVGEVTDKHVQIPIEDADLYADVADRVTLSFDWDQDKGALVGVPSFQNFPATVSNLEGMAVGCPPGKLNGAYEHFDIVEIKVNELGAIELIGKRIHPDTMVAESCGSGLRLYKGGDETRSEYIGAPDPAALAYGNMLPKGGPIAVTPDGKSIVMTALNNNWVWTYTPTPK